jgi:hypothetical protein
VCLALYSTLRLWTLPLGLVLGLLQPLLVPYLGMQLPVQVPTVPITLCSTASTVHSTPSGGYQQHRFRGVSDWRSPPLPGTRDIED